MENLHMFCFVIITFLLSNDQFVTPVPYIFTDTYTSCGFNFRSMKKEIRFPNKLWTINSRDFVIHFSLCNQVQEVCKNQTSSCLFMKDDNVMLDLGHKFIPADADDPILQSNGTKCHSDASKNYTVSISLQCSDSMRTKPRLMALDDENECNFEVTMMMPNCKPRCTEIVQGSHRLDLRNFPQNIPIQSDNRRFSVSVCGSNKDCSGDVSACEINGDGSHTSLAKIESQLLVYNAAKNELTSRGQVREFGGRRDVQILIKCNWETELANPIYKKVMNQGQHYRFELESSYGCIKLSHSCLLTSISNLNYDLRKLYNPNGWLVGGVPEGKIFLNICGPLKQATGLCSTQYSQVCHITGNNYKNRGSILSFEAHDDFIKASFKSGSTCVENTTLLYSTEMELKCSGVEKGPVFKEVKNCVMFLIWETPQACPYDYYKSQNCYVNNRVYNRNLKNLYTDNDRVYSLTPNTKLIYNLCGPIHVPCNNYKNVSFCLKNQNNERVLGWDTREVISENGLLRIEFKGKTCLHNQNEAQIVVTLICNFEDPPPPPQIQVTEDSCKYAMTIFTSLACTWQGNFKSCIYHSENVTYDLSPLILKNKNYVINDGDIEYIFNLCGPIISGPEALCRGNTMCCLRNTTELNVKYQYRSLGGVSEPRLFNNNLVIEAPMGAYCAGLGYYKSVFHFKCSKTNIPPKLLLKEPCVYNFQWETPEACPKNRNCTINGSKADTIFDVTKIKNKIKKFKINGTHNNEYEFHLCKDIYTKYSNGSRTTNWLQREYQNFNGTSYIIFKLNERCDIDTLIKVIFKLECSETEENLKVYSLENCILSVILGTPVVCSSVKEKLKYEIITQVPTVQKDQIKTEQTYQRAENNCTVFNANTGYEFYLKKLKLEEIYQTGKLQKMVPQLCPVMSFNYSSQIVKLQYSTATKCGSDSYELEVLLNCNSTKTSWQLFEDEKCKSVILYNLPEACFLLKQEIVSASVSVPAIAGSVTSILIIFIIVGIYLYRRRYNRFPYITIPFHTRKTCVPVYCRDSTE